MNFKRPSQNKKIMKKIKFFSWNWFFTKKKKSAKKTAQKVFSVNEIRHCHKQFLTVNKLDSKFETRFEFEIRNRTGPYVFWDENLLCSRTKLNKQLSCLFIQCIIKCNLYSHNSIKKNKTLGFIEMINSKNRAKRQCPIVKHWEVSTNSAAPN